MEDREQQRVESYRPGDQVPESGIFRAVHSQCGQPALEVVLIAGTQFPPCPRCNGSLRYWTVCTAPYLLDDDDFRENGN